MAIMLVYGPGTWLPQIMRKSGYELGSSLGLSSDRFGTLTAGRQYDPAFDYLTQFESAVAATGLGVHVGDNDDAFGSYRYNNSGKYQTPVVGGLRGEAMYAMSNAAGEWALNRSMSAGIAYDRGQLKFAAIYLQNDLAWGRRQQFWRADRRLCGCTVSALPYEPIESVRRRAAATRIWRRCPVSVFESQAVGHGDRRALRLP
ncbi:porin [Paraburkholderia xenovorans]|uniref:porin n=1 Tax=Paraburkholderia xenovorans TaxID=36873 RepID=UPI000037E6C0|nr:porin [Paraburkholderia xenovorans]